MKLNSCELIFRKIEFNSSHGYPTGIFEKFELISFVRRARHAWAKLTIQILYGLKNLELISLTIRESHALRVHALRELASYIFYSRMAWLCSRNACPRHAWLLPKNSRRVRATKFIKKVIFFSRFCTSIQITVEMQCA
jgi:hypothetical protein